MMSRGSGTLLTIGLCAAFSCGLINSDIAKISFNLPQRTYSFDTSQAGWNSAAAAMFAMVPPIQCTTDEGCCSPLIMAAGINCSLLTCDLPTQSCALVATVETPPQPIDIKSEAPELGSFNNQSLLDITISKITYDVTGNTLNVDLPEVELFVAPATAMSIADGATRFGTVPVIASGTNPTDGNVTLDKAGQDAFVGFAHHFGTPFAFMARTKVTVIPGRTPVPMGGLSLTVKGRLSAKPSL